MKHGLILFIWGNISAFDEKTGYLVIKPSGVSYDGMKPEDMVVVDLEGRNVEGRFKPLSDTPKYIERYKALRLSCIRIQSGRQAGRRQTEVEPHMRTIFMAISPALAA